MVQTGTKNVPECTGFSVKFQNLFGKRQTEGSWEWWQCGGMERYLKGEKRFRRQSGVKWLHIPGNSRGGRRGNWGQVKMGGKRNRGVYSFGELSVPQWDKCDWTYGGGGVNRKVMGVIWSGDKCRETLEKRTLFFYGSRHCWGLKPDSVNQSRFCTCCPSMVDSINELMVCWSDCRQSVRSVHRATVLLSTLSSKVSIDPIVSRCNVICDRRG